MTRSPETSLQYSEVPWVFDERHVHHAEKDVIDVGFLCNFSGRAPLTPLRQSLTVYPGLREASIGCRYVVVKQALCRVQNVVRFDAQILADMVQQVLEIETTGFVGPDIFRCVDRIKFDAELAI